MRITWRILGASRNENTIVSPELSSINFVNVLRALSEASSVLVYTTKW